MIVTSPSVECEIQSDGRTVWVNTPAGTVARFGVNGIDVHTADTTGCLNCTPTGPDDWAAFVAAVAAHHGITIGAEHTPTRFAVNPYVDLDEIALADHDDQVAVEMGGWDDFDREQEEFEHERYIDDNYTDWVDDQLADGECILTLHVDAFLEWSADQAESAAEARWDDR